MIVAGGDHRADACKVRGMSDGSQHLGSADVGTAPHADAAIGVRKRGSPLDGVVTVGGFIDEGVPIAIGRVAAADILHDDDIAARGGFVRELDLAAGTQFVVRSALQEDGEFAIGVGTIDVGAEGNTIAHFCGHAALHFNRKSLREE